MHLVTHGFFKAGLFLGAGSVMHGMNDEVDMREYGGLRKYMPITFVTFGLGYLAIIGFPGLSGFFSKDKIIEAAFAKGGTEGWILGSVALLGAAITAFYMTRVMMMTFFGEKRWQPDADGHEPHPHESPEVMTIPMIVLAFGSVFAGGYFASATASCTGWSRSPGTPRATRPSAPSRSPWPPWWCSSSASASPTSSTGAGPSRSSPRAARCSPGRPAATCSRTTSTMSSWSAAASTSRAPWSTSTTPWSTASSTARPPRWAASPGGCASCRTAMPASYAVSMFGGAAVLVAATLLMRAV